MSHRIVTIIVNPRAGHGRAARILKRVLAKFRATMADAEIRVIRTRSYDDACERAQAVIEASRHDSSDTEYVLVMMGGDGMAQLGANVCAGSDVALGVIPAGTGDDFARGVGIPRRPLKAAEAIAAGRERVIDLILAEGEDDFRRYVGTVVCTGFDARVNRRVNHSLINVGAISYSAAIIAEMADWRGRSYHLRVDGKEINEDAVLISIGNTSYFGGGLPVCPSADPSDGIMNITFIPPVTRRFFATMASRIYSGEFVKHPIVRTMTAERVELLSTPSMMMADGEELHEAPITLTCAPRILKVLVAEPYADDHVEGPSLWQRLKGSHGEETTSDETREDQAPADSLDEAGEGKADG